MKRSVLSQAIAATLFGLLPGDAASDDARFSVSEGKAFLASAAEQARQAIAATTFEQFKATVFKEPFEGGKYIVNGDTPISGDAKLSAFWRSVTRIAVPTTELAVHQVNGEDTVWAGSVQHALSYCVSNTFGEDHDLVAAAMNEAGAAWEFVADIDFIHVAAEDGNCTALNSNVLFDVRPVSAGAYLARAFFPDDARPQRNVLIDDSSFGVTGSLTLTGILRHELGHTVGFRHEHTRPESGTCFEDSNWRGVTDYDAFSVMHYPQCNGQGDWSLVLTGLDQNGAACLYGPSPGFIIDQTICPQPPIPGSVEFMVSIIDLVLNPVPRSR